MMLVGISYRFSSHSRHFLTMGCSHYPLLHFPPPLRCRSRFGRGRDVYEFKSKVVEKKNGVEESEKDISIVVGALSDNPIHGFKFDNDNSPNIRTSLAAQIPIDPALGDPALVSHTTLSEIGDVSASHASFGHAIADLVGALDTGIGSRHRFVFTAIVVIGIVVIGLVALIFLHLLGGSATVAMSRMRHAELCTFLKTEALSDPLLQLAIGRLIAPGSALVVEIIAPPSSNIGALLAGRGSVGAGGDAAEATGLEDANAAILAAVVARRGRRVFAISPSLNEATTGEEDDAEGEQEIGGRAADHTVASY